MSDSVSIRIEGPKVTPNRFVKAIDRFFSIVSGVTKNVTGESKPDVWSVDNVHLFR